MTSPFPFTAGEILTAAEMNSLLETPTITGSGSTNAVTFSTANISAGALLNISNQKTTGVSTRAVQIMDNASNAYGSLILVSGSDGTNRFMDLILCGLATGTVNVISSLTISGTAPARTYSQSSSAYRVAFASGTFTVSAVAFGITP